MPKVLKTIFAVLFILCLIIPGVFFFTAVTKEDFPKFAEDGKLNTSLSLTVRKRETHKLQWILVFLS